MLHGADSDEATDQRRTSASALEADSSSDSSSARQPRAEKQHRRSEKKKHKHKKEEKRKRKAEKRERKADKRDRKRDAEERRSVITGKRIRHQIGSAADEEGDARRARLRDEMNGDECEGAWKKAPRTAYEELAQQARW